MSNTATFTIDSATALEHAPIVGVPAELLEGMVAVEAHTGEAAVAIPFRATYAQAQAIAEALQGQEVSTEIRHFWRSKDQKEATLEDKRVYMRAFEYAVDRALFEHFERLTAEGEQV